MRGTKNRKLYFILQILYLKTTTSVVVVNLTRKLYGAPAAVAAAAKSLQLCPTVQPHRQQPTRLPCPWDSPGKNTGVGCHFLLQCMKVKSEREVAHSCLTLSDLMGCGYQAPPSMGFSRREYWSGVPSPFPMALPHSTENQSTTETF